MKEIKVLVGTRDGVPIAEFSKVIKGEERVVVYQRDTLSVGELLDKAMAVFKRYETPLDLDKIKAEFEAMKGQA